MGLFYRLFVRPALKLQDSEKAHLRSLKTLRLSAHFFITRFILKGLYNPHRNLGIQQFGLHFNNPFGVAAGMDKSAHALLGWSTLGVGFTEIGGITEHQQDGNLKPRMFRLDAQQVLINRMGFNNIGSDAMAKHLSNKASKRNLHHQPLWANIGKSKITELSEAKRDYATTIERLWPHVDVFVINVSSPNTPQLRELQDESHLLDLLEYCEKRNQSMAEMFAGQRKPMLVKVAPDLNRTELEDILTTLMKANFDGIVLCNTTTSRPSPNNSKEEKVLREEGGLSGRYLHDKSVEMISHAYKFTNGNLPIVGVGGIMNSQDAIRSIRAGASLIQGYSSFVFSGPSIVKHIVRGVESEMKKENITHYHELVGRDHGF
jgi:dihydroorotate dehydrogenase